MNNQQRQIFTDLSNEMDRPVHTTFARIKRLEATLQQALTALADDVLPPRQKPSRNEFTVSFNLYDQGDREHVRRLIDNEEGVGIQIDFEQMMLDVTKSGGFPLIKALYQLDAPHTFKEIASILGGDHKTWMAYTGHLGHVGKRHRTHINESVLEVTQPHEDSPMRYYELRAVTRDWLAKHPEYLEEKEDVVQRTRIGGGVVFRDFPR